HVILIQSAVYAAQEVRILTTLSQTTRAPSRLRRILFHPDLVESVVAILVALLVGAFLIAILNKNPLTAYAALLEGAAGSLNSLAETLLKAIPLTLAGVGVSIAFRANVFNVGAEGQL